MGGAVEELRREVARLSSRVEALDRENAALKRENAALKTELAGVKQSVADRLAALEKAMSKEVLQASFRPAAAR